MTNGGSSGDHGYAGDLDATQAWALLSKDPDAVLVDVRSRAEWEWVGIADLSVIGKQPVLIEWQVYPQMNLNSDFAGAVARAGVPRDKPVVFLCRSGGRSRAAAIVMTAAGYGPCYNLSGGFEGPPDGERHRGKVDGWKAQGLPWVQG